MRLPHSLSTIRSLPFSDGLVLFWPAGGRVWVLNETAAFVWGLLGGDIKYSRAVAVFAEAFGIPLETAESGLQTALRGFASQGLLAGGSPHPSARDNSFSFPSHGSGLPGHCHWAFDASFGLAGHHFSLRTEDPGIGGDFLSVLDGLNCHGAFPERKKMSIAVAANPTDRQDCDIYVEGNLCFHAVRRISVVPALMTIIFSWISRGLHHCMLFHAAVLVREGRALILPGVSGSGKTTLAALLAANGWTFFSDELAPVEPETGRVLSVPMPMSVKSGSVQVLLKTYPQLAASPEWHRLDGKRVRYLVPPDQSLPERVLRAGVHKIVFPEFDPARERVVAPLDKVAALELLAATGSSDRVLRGSDVKTMAGLVEATDSYRLIFSNPESAIKNLEELFAL